VHLGPALLLSRRATAQLFESLLTAMCELNLAEQEGEE
jgi:hypothetical protein